MKIRIEITNAELTSLIMEHLSEKLGSQFDPIRDDVRIEVKSKQNYKSEWESADFRAIYESTEA